MMLIIGKSNVKFAVLIFQVCTTYIEMNYFGKKIIYIENIFSPPFFKGTIGLASHRDRVHSQLLPCPHCEKLLPSKVKLEYHMISHMTPEEKKYICEKCGKFF